MKYILMSACNSINFFRDAGEIARRPTQPNVPNKWNPRFSELVNVPMVRNRAGAVTGGPVVVPAVCVRPSCSCLSSLTCR